MPKASDKLRILADAEGFSDVQAMLEKATFDSVAHGICMNEGCDYSVEIEPDACDGYCDECGTNTVKSCLVLAGII
jgi:hypothetical protein